MAKVNDDVDSTEIFTSDEVAQGANMAQLCDDSESVDSQEYYSDKQSDHGEDTTKYTPPTPPRPRDGEGAFRVILDHDLDLDTTKYFRDSEDKSLDDAEWLMKYTGFPWPTPEEFLDQEIFYSDCKDNAPPMSNTTVTNETHESYGLSVSNFDQSLSHNLTSDSAYEGDISNVATDTS